MPNYAQEYLDLEAGYDSDHAYCVCGHTKVAHRHSSMYGEPNFGPCTQFDIVEPHQLGYTGITKCNCKRFKYVDWITGYTSIPKRMSCPLTIS